MRRSSRRGSHFLLVLDRIGERPLSLIVIGQLAKPPNLERELIGHGGFGPFRVSYRTYVLYYYSMSRSGKQTYESRSCRVRHSGQGREGK